jgi:nucleotide-binding universal stress UspA family protein
MMEEIMPYKIILVHVDNGKRCPVRLELAARLAHRDGAQVIGVHARTVKPVPSLAAAEAGPILLEAQQRMAVQFAAEAEAVFRRAMNGAGLDTAEWRSSTDDALGVVVEHARYADLVVIGQPGEAGEPGVEPWFAHHLVLAVGRPVLVVPLAGEFRGLGERVLLAWNGGREAVRASSDGLPMMQPAREVMATTVRPGRSADVDAAVPDTSLGRFLTRHGVRVKVTTIDIVATDVGEELLSRAAAWSSDLVVMGAYGHSRLRELILGGVTRTMFESMTVPTLMSH